MDDIPSPTNCLHGAFIYSTKPLARVKGIKLKPTLDADGISAVISFKDIPGENVGSKTVLGSEPLFADDFTRCAGQYIALVVISLSSCLSCPPICIIIIIFVWFSTNFLLRTMRSNKIQSLVICV